METMYTSESSQFMHHIFQRDGREVEEIEEEQEGRRGTVGSLYLEMLDTAGEEQRQ